MHTLFKRLVLAAAAAAATPPAAADFFIVTHVGNAQPALTQKEAVDLFMGRNRAFANGDFTRTLDLPRDHPRRAAFYQVLTGMNAVQVNSYWSRLMFSGQNMPPQALPDEAAVIEAVKRNPSALGWLSKEPTDKQLRTLLVLRE